MAGKIIRDYTPGVNDFLHFAEVMNKNAAIDMRKNTPSSPAIAGASPRGEALGGALGVGGMPAVQQTPEALSGPAALERIQQNFKAVGGKI